MKKILFYFIIFSVFLCQSIVVHASKSLAPFDEIVATGNVLIDLVEGDEEAIKIKKGEDQIKVDVNAGVLRIRRKKMYDFKIYKKDETIKVKVTYRQLRSITGNAGAEYTAARALTGDQLKLNMNSGAGGEFKVSVNALKLQASEGSQLAANGTTNTLDVRTSSGAKIDAYGVKSERTYVKAHTAGEARVIAPQYLEAAASTGGVVTYKGKPDEMVIKEDLGGKVEKE